jgi:hypothetical protein
VDVDEEGLQPGSIDAATAARPLRTKCRLDMPVRFKLRSKLWFTLLSPITEFSLSHH